MGEEPADTQAPPAYTPLFPPAPSATGGRPVDGGPAGPSPRRLFGPVCYLVGVLSVAAGFLVGYYVIYYELTHLTVFGNYRQYDTWLGVSYVLIGFGAALAAAGWTFSVSVRNRMRPRETLAAALGIAGGMTIAAGVLFLAVIVLEAGLNTPLNLPDWTAEVEYLTTAAGLVLWGTAVFLRRL